MVVNCIISTVSTKIDGCNYTFFQNWWMQLHPLNHAKDTPGIRFNVVNSQFLHSAFFMWLSLAPDRFWRQIREVTLITLLNLQPNPFKAWLTTLLETFFPFLKTLGTMRLWPFMNAYLSRFVSKNSNKECYDTLGDLLYIFYL